MKNEAIVFTGGNINIEDDFYSNIKYEKYDIFCADSGANYTYKLGVIPKYILGDFDSINIEVKNFYLQNNVEFKEFDSEKDKTDTELILEYVSQNNYKKIYILGALGERSDHMLANIFILENYKNVEVINEKERIIVCNSIMVLDDLKGKTISILSLTDYSYIEKLTGFKYNIFNKSIKRNSSVGISNIVSDNRAIIKVSVGKLLVFINTTFSLTF